jgi:adenine phosphoribosyltransferase
MMTDIQSFIRDIPDFPKPGIIFKDITPLLKDPSAFNAAVDQLIDRLGQTPCDAVVGIESRGFIFGAAMALKMNLGFIPVRKPGKLPYETVSASYELEYGTDSIEIHKDALTQGQKVVLVDDLLATGGTMSACTSLVESLGAEIVACLFVIELGFLKGRDKIKGQRIESLIEY